MNWYKKSCTASPNLKGNIVYRNQWRREISSWHWVYNAEEIIHSGGWFMRSSGFRWTLKSSLQDLIIFSKLQLLLGYRLHYNSDYKSNQRQGQDGWHQQRSSTSDPDLCCICAKKFGTGCCCVRSYHMHMLKGISWWLLQLRAVTNHSESVLVPIYQPFFFCTELSASYKKEDLHQRLNPIKLHLKVHLQCERGWQ